MKALPLVLIGLVICYFAGMYALDAWETQRYVALVIDVAVIIVAAFCTAKNLAHR